jgi:hypothetical protein
MFLYIYILIYINPVQKVNDVSAEVQWTNVEHQASADKFSEQSQLKNRLMWMLQYSQIFLL